jgi:aerobic-type carbon monoxide dehydrogenase small subunit (CoxS/CutS family)
MAGKIELAVNGTRRAIASEGEASLLSVLRDEIGLTGALKPPECPRSILLTFGKTQN